MKCEHGHEITVSSVMDIDKDYYNKEGNMHQQDDKEYFLLIYGCHKCNMIEVFFNEKAKKNLMNTILENNRVI